MATGGGVLVQVLGRGLVEGTQVGTEESLVGVPSLVAVCALLGLFPRFSLRYADG